MLSLKTNYFCGISDRANWKVWLKSIAPDLHNRLIETQRQTSCRKNTVIMKEIRTELYSRQLGAAFESFIKTNYPMIIEQEIKPVIQKEEPTVVKQPPKPVRTAAPTIVNKHNVFKNYRAGLLTFPHKKILINPNKQHLEAIIQSFIKDKVGVDYIIVDDHAYIEYFNKVYANEVDKITKESRDIYQYRLKNNVK